MLNGVKHLAANIGEKELLGEDKSMVLKHAPLGEINLPPSQAALMFRAAVATDAKCSASARRGILHSIQDDRNAVMALV
jgi:hypothetical protein